MKRVNVDFFVLNMDSNGRDLLYYVLMHTDVAWRAVIKPDESYFAKLVKQGIGPWSLD